MRTHVARVRMIAVLIFGFHISGTVVFGIHSKMGKQLITAEITRPRSSFFDH